MRGTRIAIVGFSMAAVAAGAAVTAPVLFAKKEGGRGGRNGEEGGRREAGFQRPSMRGALKQRRNGDVAEAETYPVHR